MIPFLPDLSVPPGAAAPGLPTQPGAALRGGPNTPGAGLDFAGILNAALPEGEIAAPALTNLPATVPDFAPEPRGAPFVPVSVTGTVTAAPSAPAPQPTLLREVPQPPATRLPPGTLLPDSGAIVPQPDALQDVSVAPPVDEAPTILPESDPALVAPETAAPVIAVQLRADTSGEQDEPISLPDSEQSDEALIVPAAVPIAVSVALVQTPPPTPIPARAAIRTDEPRAGPTLRAERTPLPARLALPETDGDIGTTPAPAAMLAEAPPPTSPSAQQPAPTTAPLAPTSVATPAITERAEPRVPVANQESAIAAVGEIREAQRAARPEMTLRHADFGFVSLRIEPTGTQDWRAVLASRDPGFVPAIHAALAERAVTANADTAGTGFGTGTNASQNGASDQRYGSSPNGGQGSSQPYLSQYGGHSGGRDEGQSSHPQNRQQSTTDTVVARAGEADGERPDRSERGVFA